METTGLGKRIREIRQGKGMTQVELARLIGVNPQTIRDYEAGRRAPTMKGLPVLANALGVSASELLDQESEFIPAVALTPGQVLRKYLGVPDDVIDLAQGIPLDHQAWEYVRSVLKHAHESIEKDKASEKGATGNKRS